MLVSQRIVDSFNTQIGNELGASHQYIAIASYFDNEDLNELAGHFFRQADEERAHAMKFVHFLLEVGGAVRIPPIAEPRSDIGSAEEAVTLSLEWEKEVTQQIYDLVELCQTERNHIASRFLDWFVTEQLEEVSSMSTLLGIVKRAGDGNLLYVEEYIARHGVASAEPPAG